MRGNEPEMELKDKFNSVWVHMKNDTSFKDCAIDNDVSELELKYVVACAVGVDDSEGDKCDAIGIKQNNRAHRRLTKSRDDETQQHLRFLVTQYVHSLEQPPEAKEHGTVEDVLRTIIFGNARDSDKVSAIKSLEEIEKRRQGSTILKPFERLWIDVIIPNMLQPH